MTDNINENNLEDFLENASEIVHPSGEAIANYVNGQLEERAYKKIQIHIDGCEICREALDVIKKTLVEPTQEEIDNIPFKMMPDKLMDKSKLIIKLKEKKKAVIAMLAQSILPEDLHFAIAPALEVFFKGKIHNFSDEQEDLKMAAFSSSSFDPDFEKVNQAILKSDRIYNEILVLLENHSLEKALDIVLLEEDLGMDDRKKTEFKKKFLELFE